MKEETQRRKVLLKVTAHQQKYWCLNPGVQAQRALPTSVLPTWRVFYPHPGRVSKAISVGAEPPGGCLPHDTHSRSQHDSSTGWPGPPHCRITQHPLRQVLERPAITPTLPGARRVGMEIIKEEGDRPFLHHQKYLPPPAGISVVGLIVHSLE